MDKEAPAQKRLWDGKVSEKLKGPRAEQVWPLLRDFFNLHKWLTSFTTCYGVEGVSGELGCVRYCSVGSGSCSSWLKEKLVAIDDVQRSLTYELLDSNVGFKSYRATMKVEGTEEEDHTVVGCVIEWSFELEPLEGLKLEDFIPSYKMVLQRMARTVEDALAVTPRLDEVPAQTHGPIPEAHPQMSQMNQAAYQANDFSQINQPTCQPTNPFEVLLIFQLRRMKEQIVRMEEDLTRIKERQRSFSARIQTLETRVLNRSTNSRFVTNRRTRTRPSRCRSQN